MFGYIYKTTNLINNRCYIGKKVSSTFVNNYFGSGLILQEAIKKYGKENFKIEILQWAKTETELNQLEIYEIARAKKSNRLYNIAEGGTGGNTLLDHPDKIEIVKKRNNALTQWHASLSEEEKILRSKKISQSKKGKSNGHTGFKHTPETIEKIRATNKAYTKTKDWKEAHALAAAKRRGKPFTQKYKSVIVNDIEYISVKHALEALNIKHRATFYDRIKRGLLKVEYK